MVARLAPVATALLVMGAAALQYPQATPPAEPNDFTAALKRIDAETSDYCIVGYYSSNTDPTRRRRSIEIKVTRPVVAVHHRTQYVPPPRTP